MWLILSPNLSTPASFIFWPAASAQYSTQSDGTNSDGRPPGYLLKRSATFSKVIPARNSASYAPISSHGNMGDRTGPSLGAFESLCISLSPKLLRSRICRLPGYPVADPKSDAALSGSATVTLQPSSRVRNSLKLHQCHASIRSVQPNADLLERQGRAPPPAIASSKPLPRRTCIADRSNLDCKTNPIYPNQERNSRRLRSHARRAEWKARR